MTWDFLVRTFAGLVPLIGEMFKIRTSLRQAVLWWVSAENKVGSLGPVYKRIWKTPVRALYGILIALLCLFGIVAVIGIAAYSVAGPADDPAKTFEGLRAGTIWGPLLTLHTKATWFIGAYLVVAFLTWFNAISWLNMKIARAQARRSPELLFQPGFATAVWQLKSDLDAAAVNINQTSCAQVSGAIAEAIAAGDNSWRNDRASMPAIAAQLSIHERATLLLVGNTIEGGLHLANKKLPSWRRLYDLLAEIAAGQDRPFDPSSLRAPGAAGALYGKLRAAAVAEPQYFPDLPAVTKDVSDCVQKLIDERSGSAANLAGGPTSNPDLDLAKKRLEDYPQMGTATPKYMAPQFLRLAVRWHVWRFVKSAPLVYATPDKLLVGDPLLAYLFDTGCIRVSKNKDITVDENLKRVAVKAIHEISLHFAGMLNHVNAQPLMVALREEISPGAPAIEWSVYDWVDTYLWHRSEHRANAGNALDPMPSWTVNGTVNHV
jgi:hypothetical protein